jgi:hypothetical protein
MNNHIDYNFNSSISNSFSDFIVLKIQPDYQDIFIMDEKEVVDSFFRLIEEKIVDESHSCSHFLGLWKNGIIPKNKTLKAFDELKFIQKKHKELALQAYYAPRSNVNYLDEFYDFFECAVRSDIDIFIGKMSELT